MESLLYNLQKITYNPCPYHRHPVVAYQYNTTTAYETYFHSHLGSVLVCHAILLASDVWRPAAFPSPRGVAEGRGVWLLMFCSPAILLWGLTSTAFRVASSTPSPRAQSGAAGFPLQPLTWAAIVWIRMKLQILGLAAWWIQDCSLFISSCLSLACR